MIGIYIILSSHIGTFLLFKMVLENARVFGFVLRQEYCYVVQAGLELCVAQFDLELQEILLPQPPNSKL